MQPPTALPYQPSHLAPTSTIPILLSQAVFKSGPNWNIISQDLGKLITISAKECEALFGVILEREGVRERIGGSNSRIVKELVAKLTNIRKNSLVESIIARSSVIAETGNQIDRLNSGKLDSQMVQGLAPELRPFFTTVAANIPPPAPIALPQPLKQEEEEMEESTEPVVESPPPPVLTRKEKLNLAKERKAEQRKAKRIAEKNRNQAEKEMEDSEEEGDVEEEEVEEEVKPKPRKGAPPKRGRKRKGSEPTDASPVTDRTKKRLKTDELTESDQEKDHLARLLRFKRGLSGVLKLTTEFPSSAAFITPVKLTDAPGYDIAVKRPMCLKEISAKVRQGAVTSAVEVQRDVALICANAVMFNDEGVDVVRQARELWEYFGQQLQLFLATHQGQE